MVRDSCVPSRRARGSEFPPVRKIVTSRLLAKCCAGAHHVLGQKIQGTPQASQLRAERPLQTTYEDTTHESTLTDVKFKSEWVFIQRFKRRDDTDGDATVVVVSDLERV